MSGSYERTKRVLADRIRWNRASGQARQVVVWADLQLNLLQAGCRGARLPPAGGGASSSSSGGGSGDGGGGVDNEDERLVVLMQKVHAMLSLGEAAAATQIACVAARQAPSPRTLAIAFLATLHALGGERAAGYVLEQLAGRGLGVVDDAAGLGQRCEGLQRLLLCRDVATEADAVAPRERQVAVLLLLQVLDEPLVKIDDDVPSMHKSLSHPAHRFSTSCRRRGSGNSERLAGGDSCCRHTATTVSTKSWTTTTTVATRGPTAAAR
jgi:hypothetical protein